MYNYMFSIPMFIVVVAASAFFVVAGLHRRNTGDRVRKFIPSIVCFVLSANLTFLLFFGWDIVMQNFLLLIAALFFDFVSLIAFISTLIFAFVIDMRDRRTAGRGREVKDEEQ